MVDAPGWIKNKKGTTKPVNDDDKCFQYAANVALNHKKFGTHVHRIPKSKSFINKYNWKEINYPSRKDDWKKCEKNNPIIALNVMYDKKWIYILRTYQRTT